MKVRIKAQPPEDSDGAPAPLSYVPTKEYLDSIWGNITKHGIKVMADGRQWVIHCLTGKPIPREEARPMRDPANNILWIGKNETLSPLDRPSMLQWKNPDHSSTI